MGENVKDWKTTLSGLGLILLTALGGIARIKYPAYAEPINGALAGIAVLGGSHLIFGAQSAKGDPSNE